jgi:hypothetical protein
MGWRMLESFHSASFHDTSASSSGKGGSGASGPTIVDSGGVSK